MTWRTANPLPAGLSRMAYAQFGDTVVLAGGLDGGESNRDTPLG